MPAPFRTAQYTTANRPLAADWMGAVIFDLTDNRLTYSDGSAWFELMPYTAGAALTEVNDTNVTLTLGGTPTTALLKAVSITAGWTGRLAYGRFIAATQKSLVGATAAGDFGEVTLGTGVALAAGVLSATGSGGTVTSIGLSAPLGGGTVTTSGTLGTSTFTNHGVLLGQATSAIVATAAGAANTFLAGVASADPVFRAVNVGTADVTGILTAPNGGTSNGFTAFTGPATSTKTFTLPNASDTIACLGQTQSFTAKQTFTAGLDGTGAAAATAANIIFRGRSGGAAATTGLRLLDTDDSNTLRITCGSDLTANRTLNIISGDANRALDISAADVTITAAGATFLGTPTSANLAALLTDETGTGAAVFAGSPTLTGTITAAAANFSGAVSSVGLSSTGFAFAAGKALNMGISASLGNITAYDLSAAYIGCVYDALTHAFNASGTTKLTVAAAVITATVPVKLPTYTVATLPAAATAGAGATAYVTDALAPTFLTAVVGGGAIATTVFSDGTSWRAG